MVTVHSKQLSMTLFAALLLIGVLFAVAPGSVLAEQDGDYTYTVTDGKATITGYTGTGGVINIPSMLGGYPTDAIANSAFVSAAGHLVTEATIPRYLTTFGIGVFEGCSLLTAIHVDASNTNFTSINGALYNYNGTTLVECPPGISGNFTVADGTITVEYRAFVTCSKLTSITIPDSVATIGQDAFVLCRSLSVVNIGAGVSSIGPGWLAYCIEITALNVAEGNTNYSSIDGVLYNEGATTLIQHPYLKSNNFTIPSTVTTILNGALAYCTQLYAVHIPESVNSIGVEVFLGSTSLTAITVDPNSDYYMGLDGVLYSKDMSVLVACPGARAGDFVVPDGVIHIEVNAFQKCVYLTSINVSDSVQTVGEGAFMGCSIRSISFGTSFNSIGAYAFYYAGSLTAIYFRSMTAPTFVGDWWIAWSHPALTGYALPGSNFPLPGEYFYGLLMGGYYYNGTDFLYSLSEGNATITAYLGIEEAVVIPDTIDGYRVVGLSTSAFRFNEDIVSVVIPDNVTRLDDHTFYNCANLTTVNMPASLTYIGSNVFQGTKLTGDLVIPDSVISIGPYAFYCCNLTSLVMGSNVETIGNNAFHNNFYMTGDLVIPDSLTYIGPYAFISCNLTSLVMGSNVETIGNNAFQSNLYMTGDLIVPDSLTYIGPYAFYDCDLSSLVMGQNVNDIGHNAFQNNQNLRGDLVIPYNVTDIWPNTFNGCNLTSLVIGPNVKTIEWNSFVNNYYLTGALVIPDSVTYIGPGAFQNCDLTSLVMGPNVGAIGNNAFENNHRMVGNLVIPDNVTEIQPNTFNGCNLTSLSIGPNVQTIGWNAFVNNNYLTGDLVIPDSVTYIGPGAFQNCNFTSLVIGSNITIIDANVFENNRYLAGMVVIPDSVTSIGPNAFHGCSRISSFVVGTGLQTIDHNAFDACTSLTDIYFNGLLAPTSVHMSWLYNTDPSILGHAYAASNFPVPGEYFNGLLMGSVIPVAPGAPTGLQAVPGNGNVTLSWLAPADGGAPIDHYLVYQDGILVDTCATNLSLITGLVNGQSYSFNVSAVTVAGEGPTSESVSTTPRTTPDAPSWLMALVGDGSVDLNWTAPSWNGGAEIDYFVIYQDGVDVGHVIGLSTAITSLVNGQSYEFSVAAHNVAGAGIGSFAVTAVPFTVPNPPTGLVAVPGNGMITLNWTAPAFDGGRAIDYYIVYQDGVDVRHVAALNTAITGLVNGQIYEFTVSAYNLAGEGVATAMVSSVPFTVPGTPGDLSAEAQNALVILRWTAPVFDGGRYIDYYIIYQDGVDVRHVNSTMSMIHGLQNGQTYQFAVSAHNLAGEGTSSLTVQSIPFTVPDAPTGLSNVDGNGNVFMSWTAPTFDGGRPIDHYTVYLNGVNLVNVGGTSFSLDGLANGQNYSLTVSAHNLAGEGPQSGAVFSIPYTVPDVPTGLTAMEGDGNVTLNWTAPSFNGGRNIDYYIVYQDGVDVLHVTGTSVTVNGLVNGLYYEFMVSAHNLAGSGSGSAPVSSMPFGAPFAPTSLTAIAGDGNVTLSWTAPSFNGGRDIDHYVVYQDGVEIGQVLVTSLFVDGLANGQTYEFTVSASNLVDIGPLSMAAFAIPYTVPDAPTGLSAVAGVQNVTLSWAAPSFNGGRDIDHYVVYQDGVDVLHISGASIMISGLLRDQSYEFSVAAHNLAGTGLNSSSIVSTPYGVADSPADLTAVAGDANVTLNWNAPAFDGGRAIDHYIVYQDGVDIGHVSVTTLFVEGLQNGQSYEFSIAAHNLAGEGPASSPVSSTPFTSPEAPIELSAMAGNANAVLNWSSPVFDGGRAVDHYIVYQDGVDVAHVSSHTATVSGLTNGIAYTFWVSAVNLAGEGAVSNEVSATPFTVPGIPTGLTVFASNTQVSMFWNTPVNDGGMPIDYYVVLKNGVDVLHVTGNSAVVSGLSNGVSYTFSVQAHNLAGNGEKATGVIAIPFTVPDAPTGLTASYGDSQATLAWLAPAFNGGRMIDHYAVYQDGVDVKHVVGLTAVISGLTNGVQYSFTVSAHNTAGYGLNSSSVSAIPMVEPDAPTSLNAIPGNGNASLSWTAPIEDGGSEIDYYVVYQDGVDLVHVTATSVVVIGLTNGVNYSFSVASHNSAGLGEDTVAVSIVPFTIPNAPTGLAVVAKDGGAALSWNAPSFDGGRGIDHYAIYQDGVEVKQVTGLKTNITGLTNGLNYTFRVTAVNLAGEGLSSAAVTVMPYQFPPSTPLNVEVGTSDHAVEVSWEGPTSEGGSDLTGYMVYRHEDGAPAELVAELNASSLNYIDLSVVPGVEYSYYVVAVNDLGVSEPSETSETVIAWASISMDLFSEVFTGFQGIYVTTSGSVRMVYEDAPLAGMSVRISYQMSGEDEWTVLTSVTSSAAGSFILSWFPPSTGVLTVRAEWIGDDRYPAEAVTVTLAIAPSMSNGDVLSVETNSVITDLDYNSNGNFLHFKVSGEDGTNGYMKITISKDLVSDVTKLKIKIDSEFVEFTIDETADTYILFLTYQHSTHEVFAYLDYDDGADEDDSFMNLLISMVIVVAVLGMLVVALTRRKNEP